MRRIYLFRLGRRLLRPLAYLILTLAFAGNGVLARAQEPSVLLSGQIRDTAGKPVAAALLRLDAPSVHVRAVTDARGNFTILAPAIATPATLRVSQAGYVTLHMSVTLNGSNVALGAIVLQQQRLQIIGSTITHERLPFNTTPASTKVFPREAYRDQGQPSLGAVLDQTAGLQTISTSVLRGTPAYAVVRNGSTSMTATSVDGIRVDTARSGNFNLSLLPTYILQDVEVTRGAGSAAIAPHQLFGSVNFRTADPAPVTRVTFETEGDSAHGSFTDVGGTAGSDDSSLNAAMMFSVDGSSNADLASGFVADPAYTRHAGFLETRYAPNADAAITAMVLQTHLDQPGINASNDIFTLSSLDVAGRLSKNDDLNVRVYGYSLRSAMKFSSTVDGLNGASATWSHVTGGNRYEAAGEMRYASATGGGFLPGTDDRELSLRTSAELHTNDRTAITLSNAMIGLHQDAVRAVSTVTHQQTTDVVHVGAAYRLRPNLSLRASFGTGMDPEGLQTLAALGTPSYVIPTSLAYNAGAEWRMHGDTTTVSGDVYRTVVHMPFAPRTVDGAEMTVQQFKRTGLGYIVQLSLTGPQILGYQIPYMRAYEELSYKWPRGSRLSLGALTYGHGNASPGGNAFTVLNSNLELSLGRFNKAQISVENLANVRGATALFAFPGGAGYVTPRTFRFMIRQSAGGGLVER